MADIINGIFEFSGGFFILISIVKLLKEKMVKGVSWLTTAFFMSWGFWNLFYYPSLGQWWSFFGGLFLVGMNTVWVILIIYYNRKNYE